VLKHALYDLLIVVVFCAFFTSVLSATAMAQGEKAGAAAAGKVDKGGEDPGENPPAVGKKIGHDHCWNRWWSSGRAYDTFRPY